MKTISFRQDMLDLILSGKKPLTLRPIKPSPQIKTVGDGLHKTMFYEWQGVDLSGKREWFLLQCPYGVVGDIICVKEREGLLLKITGIDVERVDQLTIAEWTADGVEGMRRDYIGRPISMWDKRAWNHWQSFYGGTDYDWLRRPFVWVIRFEMVTETTGASYDRA